MKLIRFSLLLFHLAVTALLLGCLLNDYVPPKIFGYLNLLSLAFPVLIVFHIFLTIFWIFSWKKRAVFFILISVLFFNPVRRWINYSEPETKESDLKLMTMNVKNVSLEQNKELKNYFNQQDVEIMMLQEAGSEIVKTNLPYSVTDSPLIAIFSKYEIVEHGDIIKYQEGEPGSAQYADIDFNGTRIRLVNVYLNPFSITKDRVKPTGVIDENEKKARYVLRKLVPNFKIHQEEVDKIHQFVKDSPYPVIVAGDFNAVPNSYEYYSFNDILKDAFMIAGKGSSTSFHDFKFPLSIDHVFSSEKIIATRFFINRNVKISDHYPVFVNFKIKD